MAQVRIEFEAISRLQQMDLTVEQVQRALLRADAEARQSNDLDPPNLGGFSRWGKSVRFLREELLPDGWEYDNSRLFCRTIHPSGEFAIVVSSGDDFAGEFVPGYSPSTKYSKGETVVRAVATNEQLSFDYGIGEDLAPSAEAMITWFLLFRATEEKIYAELSLPSAIDGGTISDWNERIIVPPIDRETSESYADDLPDDEGGYDVGVSMR
ncbi:hypothetical protein ACWKWA_04805 [Dermacoccus abyssi]